MPRLLRLCLVSVMLVAVACGGKNNENNGTNNITIPTNNSSNNMTTNNTTPNNVTTPNNIDPMDEECEATGDACDPALTIADGFACVENVCEQSCDPQGDGSECRSGSVCGTVDPGGAVHCLRSDCANWLDTSCPAGEGCFGFVNDTFRCIEKGDLPAGADCTVTEMNQTPCEPGLLCAFGTCAALCGDDAGCDEAGGERCVGGDDPDLLDSNTGICFVGCDSYSFGQCPAGDGCFPITAEDGVCEEVGTVGPYSPCDDTNTCGEGTQCIGFQSADAATGAADLARCLPFCNPVPMTAPERNATCPQPGNASGYGRFVHLAEAGGMIDIYIDGALAVDDLAFEGVSDAGVFMTLDLGAHTIDVTAFDAADNTAPIASATPMVTAATSVTWGIIPDAVNTLAIITVPVPRGEAAPTAGSTKLRPVHAIPDFGAVDVVAVPAGAADFTNEVVLALNLANGTAAAAFTEVLAASYDVYLFPAGTTPRDTVNATGITIAGVAIAADLVLSTYARGTADDTDANDPGLTNVAYRSAPAQSGGLGGWCLNLGETAAPNSGFCIEDCATSDTFGTGACTTTGDTCTPLSGGFNGCFPGGPNGPGEMCNPDVLEQGCDGTSWCLGYGDGTALCKSYCQPTTQSNALLACTGGDVCDETGDNLGRCQTPCTADASYADTTSCPAALQTCHASDIGATAYCSGSGSIALGAVCEVLTGTCDAGLLCVNDFATAQTGETLADGVCAEPCAPFGDNSECGAGDACQIDSFSLSRAVGACATIDEDLAPAAPCAMGTLNCGQASLCLDIGRGVECVKWCDLDDASTCPLNTTCTDVYENDDIHVGFCL